jgi:hypothetical protein
MVIVYLIDICAGIDFSRYIILLKNNNNNNFFMKNINLMFLDSNQGFSIDMNY